MTRQKKSTKAAGRIGGVADGAVARPPKRARFKQAMGRCRYCHELMSVIDGLPAHSCEGSRAAYRAAHPDEFPTAKIPISIRVAPATLEAFRASGPGWQVRMNEALDREAARLQVHDLRHEALAPTRSTPILGWTKGDGSGTEGYSVESYFDADGKYLGPDEHGIEPIFDPGPIKWMGLVEKDPEGGAR